MAVVASLAESFVLGVLTPLGAVCVLPLYPAFLSHVSGQLAGREAKRSSILESALWVSIGVIGFMFVLGLLFTTILQVSLTRVIGIVSPIAFGLLAVISLLLIFNVDIGRLIPRARVPIARNPRLTSLLYGLFFGAIVVPCNPLFIAVFFTRSVSVSGFGIGMLRFLAFGFGIAAPLLALALLSMTASGVVIRWLTGHRAAINRVAGVLMLGISIYYLVTVFRVIDVLFG